ncbi:SIT4 phosphatase-associated protein-domain-containing protein [Obelidium mucronatum]|nr:SIT4 phosphatase-associated protein-domain-containing protein [Obelidium mucronatum]
MFWRFGYNPSSNLDALLEKEGVTLEELFDEEELLQECKSHNSKLIEFLCRPEILQQLLNTIINEHPDETKKFKYPYLAAEIFGCEIYAVSDAVVAQPRLLESFWSLLSRPAPISPLRASYFSKVNGILMQKKAGEMVEFVKTQPNSVSNILTHVGNSSIAELLLKIISLEEIPEGAGVVSWLSEQKLIPSLVERLDPNLDIETHNTAAQTLLDIIAVSYQNGGPMEQEEGGPVTLAGGNSLVDELKSEPMMRKIFGYMLDKSAPNATSSLSSGVIIMIELIRRYCSEIEQAEFQQHQFQTQLMHTARGQEYGILPSPEKMKTLAVDLNDLLKVIGEKVQDFGMLLEHPRNVVCDGFKAFSLYNFYFKPFRSKQMADTTLGRITPLGSERLRTCELFAEILHLQYLYFSSPLFERLVFGDGPEEDDSIMDDKGVDVEVISTGMESLNLRKNSVADELAGISDLLVNSKVLPMCLSLFFEFPWNNFLHSVVYDMIAKVFNTYSFTSQSSNFVPVGPDGKEILSSVDDGLSPLELKMKQVSVVFKKLVVSILVEGRLTTRITEAQRRNDLEVLQPKGVRLGYMGHLTYISDEVVKLAEKCLDDFGVDVVDLINSNDWESYLNGVLRETKDRDREALGGIRPAHTANSTASFGGKIDETDVPPLNAAPPPKNSAIGGFGQVDEGPEEMVKISASGSVEIGEDGNTGYGSKGSKDWQEGNFD